MKYCIVMTKLGDSLFTVGNFFQNALSMQTIVQVGIQLVTCLEKVHELGFVYNDLKPDNILIGNTSVLQEFEASAEMHSQKCESR